MKKLLITTLLLMLLFPISAMSKGSNDENFEQKKNTNDFKTIESIYDQINSLPQSNAKYNLNRICKTIIDKQEKLEADEVAELGRPNFDHDLEASLLFINLVFDYKNSTPEAKREAMYGIINIVSTHRLMKTKEDSTLFKKNKSGLILELKQLLKLDYAILKHQAASILVLLGENKKDYIPIFEKYSRGDEKDNWNLEGTRLFGYGDLYKDYLNDGFKIEEIKECARNEIRIEAFRTLIRLDPDKAKEISDYILNTESFKFEISKKLHFRYHNLRSAIKKILMRYSGNNEGNLINIFKAKYLTTNNSEVWSPDSSATYCERFIGDSLGTYSSDGFNQQYHNHAADSTDCANYGTQCLKHGGLNFKDAPTAHICPYNSNTDGNICNCDYQHAYLDSREDIMVSSFKIETEDENSYVPEWLRDGDIAICGNNSSDWYKHTIIKHGEVSNISRFGAHTKNRFNRDLDWFTTPDIAGWNQITFYHVIGSTVLESPSADSLIVQLGDTLNVKALVTNNTEPTSLNPITNFELLLKKKPENTVETLY